MKYHKKEAARQKEREKNNPMRECVLKYDHFENIHRLGKDAKVTIEGAPNVRQVGVCGCVLEESPTSRLVDCSTAL